MSSTKREQHQLVALWYGASIVAVCTAKEALLAVPAPASLCVVQFVLATLGARWLQGGIAAPTLGQPELRMVYGIALSYAGGFLLTNAALAIAAPSFVETFKSTEPLSTVAMAAMALGACDTHALWSWRPSLALLLAQLFTRALRRLVARTQASASDLVRFSCCYRLCLAWRWRRAGTRASAPPGWPLRSRRT